MLCKNISKISSFVIIVSIAAFAFSGCKRVSSNGLTGNNKQLPESSPREISSKYKKPEIVGTIKSGEIGESSGVVQSRCNKDVLWTHNDSGDGAFIYALDFSGKKLAVWKVANAANVDWEDIAAFKNSAADCFLYIADTGDNSRKRGETVIYKIKEPEISGDTESNKKNPLQTQPAEAFKIKYAEGSRDAETLLIHPETGDLYVLTKNLDAPSGVYKLSAPYKPDSLNTLKKIADVKVPSVPNGFLTGGDISPDGRRVVLCDYLAAYEFELPAGEKNFDDIWKQKPEKIDLGERRQGEACGYSIDGNSIYATSEKENSPIIKVTRK